MGERRLGVPAGRDTRIVWTLMFIGVFLLSGFTGSITLPVVTANAAPKPHATISVTDCASTSFTNTATTGTLGYALANYTAGDTVQFNCSGGISTTYTINVTNTINVNNDLTLDGNGYKVTLDGGNSVEIFAVGSGVNFTLNGLTVANGYENSGVGAGIYNAGTLTVTNSTFVSNAVGSGYNGAAIYNAGTISSIGNSSFISNTADSGGAIYSYGTISNITNTNFISNISHYYGGAIGNAGTISNINNSSFLYNKGLNLGGAIYNNGTISNVVSSSFVSNTDLVTGGALYNHGTINSVSNSAFVSNTAAGGGAIDNENVMGIVNSSFISNTALSSSTAGGAIFNAVNVAITNSTFISNNYAINNNGALTATNSIFAKSVGGNCTTAISDGGGNLSDDSTCNFGSGSHNSVANLNLGTPGYYGGNTETVPLLAGSAAIGAASTNCPATDQRGVARPATNCDSGAYQTPYINTSLTLTSTPNPSTYGQPVTLTATVSPTAATGTVTFTVGSASVTSTVTSGAATYVTNTLPVGSTVITATYSGDNIYNSSISNPITQVVTSGTVTPTTYTYYLPFVANNASNFTTYLAFQNVGSASANITVTYYDNSGNALTAASVVTQVAQYGEALPSNPLASGTQGAGIITSDQPLNVIVPEATPYGGSAYAVNSGSSSALIAPFALNNAFGDFTTQLNVFNGGSTPVTATVTFYGTVGNSTTITSTSTVVNIAAHTTRNLNQNILPSGFNGWAQITGSANTLVAQVLEQSPSRKFVAIADAIANPSTTEYAPAIFNGGYGGFYTGANIVNPNATPVTVTVTYYDLSATMTATTPFTITGYGVASIYNGATSGNGLPSGGLPQTFIGSVAVTSTGGPIAMSVNEQGGQTATGNSRSGTYAAISSGSSTVGLPVISNGGYTYVTGDTILNTSSQPVTATLTYYNINGTAANVATKNFVIPGKGSQAFYQGDGSLPNDFYGTAVITESANSPANALIVTTNAQSNALFYTYSEPNS